MAYTPDQVALAAIEEGQTARTDGPEECRHPVITPKGIQIALATELVESNDRVLANPNVPESENYPNDGDGYDHESAGPFQQQHQWWGTVAEEMDPRLSAAMFYNHLARLDYNSNNQTPGSYAQDVQGSAYPDRYDQRWGEAVAQYNRLAPQVGAPLSPEPTKTEWFREFNIIEGYPNFQSRAGQRPRLFVLHTEEGHMLGQDLATWMIKAGVSYHYVVDNDGTVYDLVDTDDASWSVLDANDYTINLVFAGSTVDWSRLEWLQNMESGIKIAAYLAVQDCKKYGIPVQLLVGNAYSRLPNTNGITDHDGITVGLHIGTHTDVGPNFPWDVFNNYLIQFAGGVTQGDDFLSALSDDEQRLLFDRTNQLWGALFNPVESKSPYRNPTPGDPANMWATKDLIRNMDGMTHVEFVEDAAKKGDEDAIHRLAVVAAGEGADTSESIIARAKEVLAEVPEDILKAYEAKQKASS